MPLSMLSIGDVRQVNKIHGKDETRRFLENLGFVSGTMVSVISESDGNLIVKVRESRIAISKVLASKIFVA
jgi:ferrous iron transport protein A